MRYSLRRTLTILVVLLTAFPAAGRIALADPPSTYTNPVIDRNFADPCILRVGGMYYAYSTNSKTQIIPCTHSRDMVHWSEDTDAMPTLPPWAEHGHNWAPDVVAIVPGKRYAAYFVARNHATGGQSIGVATSASPVGPFVSDATSPLIAQTELGGCIDPFCFHDTDGARYLVWKNDGNSRHLDSWLWIQRLSADGLTLLGTPTPLIKQDQPWEAYVIEAPTLLYHAGKYYLFYSANDYASCRYAIGYAVSSSPYGPYVKHSTTPWVTNETDVCGPGGQDFVTDISGNTWMAYHYWAKGPRTYRAMCIDRLMWDGDVPRLDGPSRSTKPGPAVR